jgi:hypothetical protein
MKCTSLLHGDCEACCQPEDIRWEFATRNRIVLRFDAEKIEIMFCGDLYCRNFCLLFIFVVGIVDMFLSRVCQLENLIL